MTCSYCGSRNGEGEHRCQRCGRRPTDILNTSYQTDGALAAKLQPVAHYEAPERARSSAPPNFSNAVQRTLFQERPASNVIPFESFAAPSPAKPRTRASAAPKTAGKPAQRRGSKVVEGQG